MRRVWIAVATVVSAAGVAACDSGRHNLGRSALRPDQFPRANVLLITIDTLRADRLGAYGNAQALTPTLDRLSASGVRFARAFSHAPMTLPAHTSILTGLTPIATGVHTNTSTNLDTRVPTLATFLKRGGYRTGAFVGAFVLDARFGLARDFDVYDDRIPPKDRASFIVAERRAADVTRAAGDWIASAAQRPETAAPFFAWVHLFDPHAPYEAPPEFRVNRSAYDAEVAYTDATIGAFLDRLRAAGALASTLVVVTADHGESLGEHGEATHGLFAYDSTIRVPLIVTAASGIGSAVISEPVEHADIAPTILDLVGMALPPGLDGQSLARPLPADRPIYIEALDAAITRGWAPLRGVVQNALKYIDLPDEELYDLTADPAEARNVAATDARTAGLRQSLARIRSAPETATRQTRPNTDAAERLRSLGYAGAPVVRRTPPSSADDPKRLVGLDGRFNAALAQSDIEAFLGILRERPDFLTARTSAAAAMQARGRSADAVALLRAAPEDQRSSPALLAKLGAAERDAGDLKAAAATLEQARAADTDDIDVVQNLATTYASLGRTDAARQLFQSLTARDRAPATAWFNLGLLELQARRPHEAATALRRAVERDPSYGEAWNTLGAALAQRGSGGSADDVIAAWKRAETLLPHNYDLLFNLGLTIAASAHPDDALPYLDRFAREAPRARYGSDIARVEALRARIAK